MRILAAIIAVLGSFSVSAIEISNFKSGLACTNTTLSEHGRGWICHETQDVLVTDQGSCNYNGDTRLCTWYGFEFDFEASEELTKLECMGETSAPTSPGNPGGILASNVTSHPFEIELAGRKGHFYNPMYFVFKVGSGADTTMTNSFTCRADGAELFQARFNLHFPRIPE
ncbi:hypothetical protein [Dokdonella sp.]|uniref:hypothetical protein n=1 Tax=Dokdonella sp. TaxID=2291710 RepID=UPI003C5D7D4F